MVSCIALKALPMNDMVTTDQARDFFDTVVLQPAFILFICLSVLHDA